MARGFNWAKARMEKIIATRGSEPVHWGLTQLEQPSRKKKRKRKKPKPAQTPRTSNGRAPATNAPVGLDPHRQARAKLAKEFRELTPGNRLARRQEFRHRLRPLCASDAEFETDWTRRFRPYVRKAEDAEEFADAVRKHRKRKRA
jgi:hypothetical protein